jgi:phospholipid/cholesterol/gamma-HCH transport system substrate-binding protein
MREQIKNMLVGVFVLGACALLVSLIMFLKPNVGDGKEILYVRFTNINNINVGTRVLFAGKAVGEVVAIEVVKDARGQKTDSQGQVFYYQLTLKIDSSVKVYTTDEISLETSGLLGEKSVSIIPRKPPKGITPQLITTQPAYGNSIDPIQSAFHELNTLASTMESTFDEITLWIQRYGKTLGCSIEAAGDLMRELNKTITAVNEQNIVGDIKCTTTHLAATMEEVHSTMTELRERKVFANIATTVDNITAVTGDIATGKGTLGKIIVSPDLYLKVTDIMNKVSTLMNDINHYGILFNHNKHWQRTRLQRANLLDSLNTPDSFKNYFETEIDQINTSMERISELVNKAEQSPRKEEIMQSDPFKKDFAELLRRADELSENLRTFNEKLADQIGK